MTLPRELENVAICAFNNTMASAPPTNNYEEDDDIRNNAIRMSVQAIFCAGCKEILRVGEFIRGIWELYKFKLAPNGYTAYCISCFYKQSNFGAYFDKKSLKHIDGDCPLVKLRITCIEGGCEYGASESRYFNVEEFIEENKNNGPSNTPDKI